MIKCRRCGREINGEVYKVLYEGANARFGAIFETCCPACKEKLEKYKRTFDIQLTQKGGDLYAKLVREHA